MAVSGNNSLCNVEKPLPPAPGCPDVKVTTDTVTVVPALGLPFPAVAVTTTAPGGGKANPFLRQQLSRTLLAVDASDAGSP
jgi:hypothetical protein